MYLSQSEAERKKGNRGIILHIALGKDSKLVLKKNHIIYKK